MLINFHAPSEWTELNDRLAEALKVDDRAVEVRGYQGVRHALVETLMGLAKLYPLKKKIIYMHGADPSYAEALTPMAKEGYQLQPLAKDLFAQPEKIMEMIEKDTLCVLYSQDDPVLGARFLVKNFESICAENNVQKVRLSHALHFLEGANLSPDKNSSYIYALNTMQAVSVVGERARVGSPVATAQSWAGGQWNMGPLLSRVQAQKESILDFEAREVAGAKPFFSQGIERVWDRAVIYWDDMDGQAVVERLVQEMSLGTEEQPSLLETTSLSRWGGVRTMDWMKFWQCSPETMRGMLLISASLLDAEFDKKLLKVRESILKDQFGD